MLRTGAYLLDLSGLRLKTLPDSIRQLTSLTDLLLNGSDFNSLPDVIQHLKNLEVLWIHDTKLACLPDWIGNLDKLEELRIGNRYWEKKQLTALTDSVGQLANLKRLAVEHTPLERLGGRYRASI